MKCVICMSVQLNILCLICINRKYPQNCIEFDNDARVCSTFIRNTVKQGRSLTLDRPDEIHYVRSKSCLPSDCWREENISRKALSFLSFQNLRLCSQVLKQTVFITVKTYSKKVYCLKFAVSRTTTSCSSRTARHARHLPDCRLTCVPMCLSSLNQKTGRRTVQI